MTGGPVVLKFGGELLEDSRRLSAVVSAVAAVSNGGVPLVIVHGGGKEIDASLAAAGIEKRQVDGLRITDEQTLNVVVAVLAGTINTRLVAALNAAGVGAVGLTGADGMCGLSDAAPPHRSVDGRVVNLERVGIPSADSSTALLSALTGAGFVPVLACIGMGRDGRLFNVNADTLAAHIAARLEAKRLVISGTTAGVLDEQGATVATLDPEGIEQMIGGGTATAGMIAKLRACEQALAGGAGEVVIVDGRDQHALEAAALGRPTTGATRLRQTTAAASESIRSRAGEGRDR